MIHMVKSVLLVNMYRPLKSFDTENRVLYAGSYSKTLSAGLRVGFLLGPEDVIGTIQALKNNTAGQMYKDLDIKEQMTINFKLTESEYVYLKYKVRIQHENYGYYNTIQKRTTSTI